MSYNNTKSFFKLYVAIAIAVGFVIGLFYTLLVWAFKGSLYPDQLRTVTALGLLANAVIGAVYVVALIKAHLLKSTDLFRILEISIAQFLSFLVTATVVFDILIN
ncbi:MAG: hypothetical protein QXN05_00445 [Acidilobaceae archaeon]